VYGSGTFPFQLVFQEPTVPTTFRVSVVLAAALAAVGLPGCGSGGTSAPPPFNEVELKEIHDLYMGHIKKHQKPPAQMSDFSKKEMETLYPAAMVALTQGKYVVVWGVSASDASAVIAFEKDAPTKGGAAILADGNIKQLMADEAKALKKP
jgi:hypothetical protein